MANRLWLRPFRQTLSRRRGGPLLPRPRRRRPVPLGSLEHAWWQSQSLARALVLAAAWLLGATATAQLVDPLDAYPPRWHLVGSDAQASVTEHRNDPVAGIAGSGCESVTLQCGRGTEALLEYRIEPTRVIDELTARVHVRSSKPGQSIGLRVRFPLVIDPASGQAVSVILYGTQYREPGRWQMLSVGQVEKSLRIKTMALRRQYGANARLDEVFADAVVINAYAGPGATTLLIDNLSVEAMVPVAAGKSLAAEAARPADRNTLGGLELGTLETTLGTGTERRQPHAPLFAAGRVMRVLQHNGEPLEWVKTLGFDAVLLPTSADAAILSEAMRARVRVYAPPPTAPDPHLTSLLEPLAGYYLGTSQDASQVDAVAALAERVAQWPAAWQRPLLVAPAESLRAYAAITDALVHDLPPPIRGLRGSEEIELLAQRRSEVGRSLADAVGVQSEAPASLVQQLDAIGRAIGAPRDRDLFWHATWLQVARALQTAPKAIVFRSSRSLTAGRPEDHHRAMALSYINRYIDAVGMLAASGVAAGSLRTSGSAYHCGRTDIPGGQLLVATTQVEHRGLAVAGDGDSLQIHLPPGDATKIAWRLTQFTAERVSVQSGPQGAWLELVSPDIVETLVLSSDPAMAGRLVQATQRNAVQAATDRWQLTRDAIQQAREDWQAATVSRIAPASRPALDLLTAAERTLREADPMFRSGDAGSALRLVRRADAWMMKSRWQLHTALSPTRQLAATTSCPPLQSAGGLATQVLWWPLMRDAGWSDNRLVGGSLDSVALLGDAGWVVGRRLEANHLSESDVQIVSGPQVQGEGCLRASVAAAGAVTLPGGYAGTTVQLRSPSVRVAARTPLRIDAQIRTLGFGGPDQGVLVYDSVSGPELGVLVRATPQWQTVRLYRQAVADAEVNVLFELIGAGEVLIDDVQVRTWMGETRQPLPLRRLSEREQLPDSDLR